MHCLGYSYYVFLSCAVAVPLATDVLYDEISLPPLTSTAAVIPTEPNSAYATTLSLKGPTPPIITEDNVAYSYM